MQFAKVRMISFWIVLISTIFVMILAVPAAYALAIRPMRKWRDVLFFFISTKFLPIVGAIMPIWIIARDLDLLNTRTILVVLYTAMNLPIMIWMVYSYFRDIPKDLVEAANIDGASMGQTMMKVILPLATPGLASTCLLALILAWNESFWSITMTNHSAATLAVFIAPDCTT